MLRPVSARFQTALAFMLDVHHPIQPRHWRASPRRVHAQRWLAEHNPYGRVIVPRANRLAARRTAVWHGPIIVASSSAP